MRLTFAIGSSTSGTNPEAGNQPSRTDTSKMSMIPSQKLGTDTPHSDTPLASRSHGVLRRTAAITPAGIAMAIDTSSDRHASSSVMGSLRTTVPATDWRVRMDSPRSPRSARPSQRAYCTGSGAFSPYFWRISSSPAASASVPASTRAGSPGIIRTPVKTITLISSSVIAETNDRRTTNSIMSSAAAHRVPPRGALLPGRRLDPHQAVGDCAVPLEVLGVGHDVVRVIQVDRVAPRADQVDGLAVEPAALRHVGHLPRLVQQGIDALVAGERGVQAALARLPLVDVAVRVDAAAPADQERLVLAVVGVGERGRELLGPERDVEAGLLGHALDDLAHPALLRVVDHDHLERVAGGEAGV